MHVEVEDRIEFGWPARGAANNGFLHRRRIQEPEWRVLVCVLGGFRLLRTRQQVSIRGPKSQALLSQLALCGRRGLAREQLTCALWPEADAAIGSHNLSSLLSDLRRQLGVDIDGKAPVLVSDGMYRLNEKAGIWADVCLFEAMVERAEERLRGDDEATAMLYYDRAEAYYYGDLSVSAAEDVHVLLVRERLRAHYSNLLARVAAYWLRCQDPARSLHYIQQLLERDPCREDAHRMAMRCYTRQGARSQALHQYHLCASVLRSEYDADPEPATTAVFDQVRLDPANV